MSRRLRPPGSLKLTRGLCFASSSKLRRRLWIRVLLFLDPLCTSRLLPLARRHTTKDRRELNKVVDADYYGYRDDEDGALVPAEAEAEMAGTIAKI